MGLELDWGSPPDVVLRPPGDYPTSVGWWSRHAVHCPAPAAQLLAVLRPKA